MTKGDGSQARERWHRRFDRRWAVGIFWALTLGTLGASNIGLLFERNWLQRRIDDVPLPASYLKVVDRFARSIQAIQMVSSGNLRSLPSVPTQAAEVPGLKLRIETEADLPDQP